MMTVSQAKCIKDILDKYNMVNCKSASTPQIVGATLLPETGMTPEEINKQPFDYRGLVGSLHYLVRGTRPDIANAVRELSKFMACYNKTHWEAALRVLRYLKGTYGYGLLINGHHKDIEFEVYTDASFANLKNDRTSVSGFLVLLAGTCVSWSSSRQTCVSLSTAESELIALSEGTKESEWLWQLLSELGMKPKQAVQIWCDSMAATGIVQNSVNH